MKICKKKGILFLVICFNIILRFWEIETFPPIINKTSILERYLSALLSVGNILLVFLFSKNLLASFIFSVLPWTIEQGRIVSQPNSFLFFLLLFLNTFWLWKKKFYMYFTLLIITPSLFIVYPQFWLYKNHFTFARFSSIVDNLFFLLSPNFLFFKNPTFWWGGVKEFGVLFLSLLPFLIIGLYKLLDEKKWISMILFLIILIISSGNPIFPEGREFFIATPIFSNWIAVGIQKIWSKSDLKVKLIILSVGLIFVYELANFLHYYTVHYPQQIMSNRDKINEKF